MEPIISIELQNIVRQNSSISKVYFDAKGRHYFNVHLLSAGKDDKEKPKLYGSGLFSHMQVIPGIFNSDNKKESIAKGNPETLIVEVGEDDELFLTREEILNLDIKTSDNKIIKDILGMSKSEREALKALLNSDEE